MESSVRTESGRPEESAGASSAVRHGKSGHHCRAGADAGVTLSPGRGNAARTPARSVAARTRSMGSVQPCSARSNSAQWTGTITSPRTMRCTATACSGPRCTSAQAAS